MKQALEKAKIKRLIVWECTVERMQRDNNVQDRVMKTVRAFLDSDELSLEI